MAQLIKGIVDTQRVKRPPIGSVNCMDDTIIELELTANNILIEYNNPTFELFAKKADGNKVRQVNGITLSEENKVIIELDKQVVTFSGITTCQLVVKDQGRISTCLFYITIGSSLDRETLQSASKIEVLEQLDEYVALAFANLDEYEKRLSVGEEFLTVAGEEETTRVTNEVGRNESEEIRKGNELDREYKENVRKNAEDIRETKEEQREESELNRKAKETNREESENIRKNNEIDRKNSENRRVENEESRLENEIARYSSENERLNNEDTRKNSEALRKQDETTRKTNETNRVASEGNRVAKEEERVVSENTRKEKFEEIKADYNTYKNVMIGESNVANLQSQINQTNSQLEDNTQDIAQLQTDIGTTANIAELKATNNEATAKITELDTKIATIGNISSTIQNVEDAKKDFNGNVKGSLDERLDSDMSYVNDRFNKASLLDYNSEYITANNSYDGYAKNLVIKGKTLQNLVTSKTSTTECESTLIKASTVYTIFAKKVANDGDVNIYENLSSNPSIGVLISTGATVGQYFSKKITTASTTNKLIVKTNTGGTTTFDSVMILEGDWTTKAMPAYFEGIASAGMDSNKIEVLSTGKNLVDIEDINLSYSEYTHENWATIWDKPIKLDYSKLYYFKAEFYGMNLVQNPSAFSAHISIRFDLITKSGTLLSKYTNMTNGVDIITSPTINLDMLKIFEDIREIRSIFLLITRCKGNITLKKFQIEESQTPYTPFKEDKINILLSEPLRSLPSGVADEVDLDNGKNYKRVEKLVFNSNETWNFEDGSNSDTLLVFSKFIDVETNLKVNFINDKFKIEDTYESTSTNESIFSSWGGIYIRILKSKLTTPDVAGFKKWLQANPVTIYYELSTPIVTDIPKQSLRTFDERTHIFSQSSLIEPTIECKVPSDVQKVVRGLMMENEELNNNVSTLSLENEGLKETNEIQNVQITDSESAINYLLLAGMDRARTLSMDIDNKKETRMEERSMESYLAKQIYKGALDYDTVMAVYPQFKVKVDAFLKEYVENDGIIYK